jgi:hypothetical protein
MSRIRNRAPQDGATGPEPLAVVADYRLSPFGPGCFAAITVEDKPARTVHAADEHEALHRVMDEVAVIADQHRRALLTIHTLDGDPAAFAELAQAQGFLACVDDAVLSYE